MIEEAALHRILAPLLSLLSSVLSFLPSSHPLPQRARARAFPSDVAAAAAAPPLLTAQCLLGNDGSLGSAQNANLAKPKLKGENVTRYDIMQYIDLLHKFTETLKKYCQLAPVAKAV